jgi:hypothetical protein
MVEPCYVLLPSYDGRYEGRLMDGLLQIAVSQPGAIGGWYRHTGCSNPQLAREECIHHFLHRTNYEWAVWIDSDIGFTPRDWNLLWDRDDVEAVCCEYRKKDQVNRIAAPMGFGFCRISRRLLTEMADLMTEDGRPMLPRFRMRGEEYVQYFPQGVLTDYDWRGEDHGFWLFAKLTGAPIALERRTRLAHVGTAVYPYDDDLAAASEEIAERIGAVVAEPPQMVHEDWPPPAGE